MASIVLQACTVRCISKSSSVMLHLQSVSVRGNVIDTRASLEEFARLDEAMIKIVAARTGHSAQTIRKHMAQDAHFDAHAALQFGLVDKII
jgi:ATP-dependent protease ClpP protease subunit